jgi:hypothetical protein
VTDLCVVLWRPDARGRWEVQPFVYAETAAEIVAARLVEQFGGEAWIWVGEAEPPPMPWALVPSELEGEE